MMGNLKLLINFVEKFLGTVKFGNDQIAPILGYGDLVQGAVTIKRVYYVEGLNHNLFSVGPFRDADLEVAFRKSTCFIRDLTGNDLLTGSCGTDLYSITLQDTNSPNLICLMAKASSSQAWLWHRRLSHLNFDTINLLSKNYIVVGLLKLKFVKDHLCSSCELGKAKLKYFHTKLTPSSKRRLQLLHMNLCGPMRVASINGKRYVLVIVDDYSRYTWTHFLRSKDETPVVLIDFLRLVQRGLQAQVRVRSGDVTRLQALVDKKKIIIFEDFIREILRLDDAEGVVCLPNEEIFAGLAQMGYEKPSTKLTFYKAFFSSQWKFLIYTILQSLSAKRTFWNEFSTAMASAVIWVEIPLFETMLEVREVDAEEEAQVPAQDDVDQENVTEEIADDVVAASTPIPAAKPAVVDGVIIRDPEEELHDDTPTETLSVKDKGKGILVEDPKPMKKKDQIEMDAEYARKLQEEEESHVQAKGIQYIKRYHGYKKKPQSKSEARKNIIAYLKTLKSREEMEKEEEEIIKSINETPAQKAAKRRRLREQAKEDENLKKQLEVVVDEDDDVFIEATPIGKKAPDVNYEIVIINNKPRFFTSKPTNFSDDYLLVTLKTMFEKTDAQDVIWRSQQTEYEQALVKSWKLLTSCGVHIITFTTTMFALLVENKYPLSRFTLEQLVNVARLQVEEESEMSLELFRFTRQQLLEYQQ
nr:retrovirus-related Pol polyprotein from transposon TNT 1-94 [Tanacetum cinerariifolium]